LLTDPRLQLPQITDEAAARTDLVKAQLVRTRVRAETLNEADYVASLNIETQVDRLKTGDAAVGRVVELFQRTTQFNTTGRKFTSAELDALASGPESGVFSLRVRDRFGDHGLVGAAVIDASGDITGLAVSCRVLGMGVEHGFLRAVIAALAGERETLTAQILATARNIPVRNLYRDNGFVQDETGVWRISLGNAAHG
jgi:FkbH-like protein